MKNHIYILLLLVILLISSFETSIAENQNWVVTNPISNLHSTGANFNGELYASNLNPNISRGFLRSTHYNLIFSDSSVAAEYASGSGSGLFSLTDPTMDHNTTYWVRSFAINLLDTIYGDIIKFTTNDLPYFNLDLRNDTFVSANVYEFDLYLMHTGNYISPIQFEMATIQCGIYFNCDFLKGGIATATIVPGTQDDLPIWQQQTNANIFIVGPSTGLKTIGISFVAPLQPGTGVGYSAIIKTISQGGSRIMRVRLTNSADFNHDEPNFHFSFTGNGPSCETSVGAYDPIFPKGINSHGTFSSHLTVFNPPQFPSMTGGGIYCSNGPAIEVGIDVSFTDCGFQLQKDGVNYGAEIIGTGGPLTWYVTESGTYTCLSVHYSIEGSSVVSDGPPPAPTGATTQTLCKGKTIGDIAIVGTNIRWYLSSTTSHLEGSSNLLVNGRTYWASQTLSFCESTNRLAVTVSLIDIPPPTGDYAQAFCGSASIADLVVVGSDIKWYSSYTGGSPLLASTVLNHGQTYFATQTIGGCESQSRMDVLVKTNYTPPVPGGDTLQIICNPSAIADLVTHTLYPFAEIKWYDAPSGGNLFSQTLELANGSIYYGSQTFGCESDRLAVKVIYAPHPVQTVQIVQVTNISQSGASFSGAVSSSCLTPTITNGFIYATHPHPILTDPLSSKIISGNSLGSFSFTANTLASGTYYWVRAYTISSQDTTYSSIVSFNTNPWPFFNLELMNGYATDPYHFEFDIYLTHTGNYITPTQFQLADIQLGIYFNSAILNGGTATATIVSGTQSNIPTAQRQTNANLSIIGSGVGLNTIKITPKTVPAGSGAIIKTTAQGGSRVMRLRLTNSVPFANAYSCLNFSLTSSNSSMPTIVNAYIGTTSTNINANGSMVNNNFYFGMDNPPPFPGGDGYAPASLHGSSHVLAGGGTYCPNGPQVMIYIDTTYNSTDYTLIRNGSNYASGTGNMHSMAWFVTSAGTYTCRAGNVMLPGSVMVSIDNVAVPSGNSVQSLCTNTTVANLVATGSDVKWYDSPLWGNYLVPATNLINNNKYYASQTLGGCESQDRLSVTYFNKRILTIKLFLEGLFNNNSNILNEALDGTTGMPEWGIGVADKIDVDLYNDLAPYNSIFNQSNIYLSTQGIATVNTECPNDGNYYIAVRNRNHLATWTSIPISFNTQNVNYNFTSDVNQAYGFEAQKQVSPYLYAFYLGDLDQGGWVDAIDFNAFEPDLTLGSTGFYSSDFNGDGWVDSMDFNLFELRLTMGVASQFPGQK